MTSYFWTPSRRLPPRFMVGMVAAPVVAVATLLWLALDLVNPISALFTLGIVVFFEGSLLGYAPNRVGFSDTEVRVERYLGSLTFPWAALAPPVSVPRGPWGSMRADVGDGRPRGFWIHRDQAEALLGHPSCPPGRFTAGFRAWAAGAPAGRA